MKKPLFRMNSLHLLILLSAAATFVTSQEVNDKLFIVGGITETINGTSDCEMIDLGDSGAGCDDPADFPFASDGGVIFISDLHAQESTPVICGGRLQDEDLQDCYQYDPTPRQWRSFGSMTVGRSLMAPAVQIQDEVWLSGGRVNDEPDDSSELMNVLTGESREAPGLLLPSPRILHCAVSYNATHIFVAGGGYKPDPGVEEYLYHSDAYLIDATDVNQATWYVLPHMDFARGGHVCGVIGNEVIVAGNMRDRPQYTEFFSMDTLSWSIGPELPITNPSMVSFNDTLMLVGGLYIDNTNYTESEDLYEWDTAQRNWTMRPEKLEFARNNMEAILVGDFVCNPH